MSKVEQRFPGSKSVSALESYLKSMKKKINHSIEKGKVENLDKARAFMNLIDDVLGLPYFEMDIDVYTLMDYLKEDSRQLDSEISVYQVQLEKAKKAYEMVCNEPNVSETFVIPDEWRQVREAEQKKRNEARLALYAITTFIEEIKKEKYLIQRLKGMICRPKGFFAKL